MQREGTCCKALEYCRLQWFMWVYPDPSEDLWSEALDVHDQLVLGANPIDDDARTNDPLVELAYQSGKKKQSTSVRGFALSNNTRGLLKSVQGQVKIELLPESEFPICKGTKLRLRCRPNRHVSCRRTARGLSKSWTTSKRVRPACDQNDQTLTSLCCCLPFYASDYTRLFIITLERRGGSCEGG